MKLIQAIKFLFIGTFPLTSLGGQESNPFHQSLVQQVETQNIQNHLTEFVGFGVKDTGSTAQTNALQWLVSKYQSWGYTDIQQQPVNIFGETGYNLIVTKAGTVYPDTFIIIDGHYDTINGVGANDNGSGTAVILEVAQALKDIPTEYSVKFIHFTGEELGLIGSEQYVENIVVPQNLDIKLVLNLDQVGGVAGEPNHTITCERDESWPNSNNSASSVVTNQLATLMGIYSNLNTEISYAYGSDYVPFQQAGFVITGLYESNESPYTHSPYDTLENMDPDYVFEVAKGTLGAMCFFAKAYENMETSDSESEQVKIFPNPVSGKLNIILNGNDPLKFNLSDLSGKILVHGKINERSEVIDTSFLPNGNYILNLIGKNFKQSQKIIVKHN